MQGSISAVGAWMPRNGDVQGSSNAVGAWMPRNGDVHGSTNAVRAWMPRNGQARKEKDRKWMNTSSQRIYLFELKSKTPLRSWRLCESINVIQ